MSDSPITSFYNNKVVFLTGCTGFLGTVVVEKLLRAFPNVKKIILLIRPSRKMSAAERASDYSNSLVFSNIDPNHFARKIVWMTGDITVEQLGLSDENLTTLIESVNIVIHCAATVKFDEPLNVALTLNVKGTQELLEIASKMNNLQSFVYVSTCYSNCNKQVIEEKIFKNKFSPHVLLLLVEELDEATLNAMSPILLQDWPNTYTFSKNVAEILVDSYKEKIPLCVFRAAGILASYKEPFPSYINKYGPNFIPIGAMLGILKVLHASADNNFGTVPVDMTANALLAAVFEVSQKNDSNLIIYNYSSMKNPLTMRNCVKFSLKNIKDCQLENSHTECLFTESELFYKILRIFYHIIPAYFTDRYLQMTGKEPRFMHLYNKMHNYVDVLKFFMRHHNWIFVYDNVDTLWEKMTKEDQDLLYFDVKSINWEECLSTVPFGIKQFVLKKNLTQHERDRCNVLMKSKI